MPTVLHLRFPARRYHATPWGAHVNEGAVEWPISPWRLTRALLSVGFDKHGWDASGPPPLAKALFASLAAEAPTFALPPACLGHSRHYVTADNKRPLILDTWARIEDDAPPVEVVWASELDPDQRALLGQLAASLGYLGRAESWVDAQLVDRPSYPLNCAAGEAPPGPGWQPVRVLCPQDAATFDAWRTAAVQRVDEDLAYPMGKKPTAKQVKDRARALEPFPTDLIDALCADTGRLQAQGWTSPPGSREVVYWRRSEALEVGAVKRPARDVGTERFEFVLLALSTPSRNRSGLPGPSRVYPQGRLLHKAIASAVGRSQSGGEALALLGRDGEGLARTDHRHAHLLHLTLGGDGDARLDHALVWVPDGLGADGLRALRAIRRTYMKGGVGELQVAIAAIGDRPALRQLDEAFHGRMTATLGPPGGALAWTSVTPFVAARRTKAKGKDSIAGQIALELARRGLPSAEVEVLPWNGDLRLSFRHHVLHDSDHQPPMSVMHAIRLRFSEPVEGPICLGWGSHAGLGRLEAAHVDPS